MNRLPSVLSLEAEPGYWDADSYVGTTYRREMFQVIESHAHTPQCSVLEGDYWRQDWRPGRELTTVQARAWALLDATSGASDHEPVSLHYPDADAMLAEHIHEEATGDLPGTRADRPGRYGDGIEWRDEVDLSGVTAQLADRPTPEHWQRLMDTLGDTVTVGFQGSFFRNGAEPR